MQSGNSSNALGMAIGTSGKLVIPQKWDLQKMEMLVEGFVEGRVPKENDGYYEKYA